MMKLNNLQDIIIYEIIEWLDNVDRVCFAWSCKKFEEMVKRVGFVEMPFQEVTNTYKFVEDDLGSDDQSLDIYKYNYQLLKTSFRLKSFQEPFNRLIGHTYQLDKKNQKIKVPLTTTRLQVSRLNKKGYLAPQVIPDGVEYLVFANVLAQPLEQGVIPDSVKQLHICSPVGNVFPKNLERLEVFFGGENITGFPDKLIELKIKHYPTLPLPESLAILSIWPNETKSFNVDIPLPRNLKGFATNCSIVPMLPLSKILPRTLEYLYMGTYVQPIQPDDFPPTLRYLGITLQSSLRHLPSHLHTLDLRGSIGNEILPGVLPSTLKRLYLSYHFQDDPIAPNILPEGLEMLGLGGFNPDQPIQPGDLPTGLIQLNMDWYSKPILPGVLPNTLQIIQVGRQFEHPLQSDVLPSSVHTLHFTRATYTNVYTANIRTVHLLGVSLAQPRLLRSMPKLERVRVRNLCDIPPQVRHLELYHPNSNLNGCKLQFLDTLTIIYERHNNSHNPRYLPPGSHFHDPYKIQFSMRHLNNHSLLLLNPLLKGGIIQLFNNKKSSQPPPPPPALNEYTQHLNGRPDYSKVIGHQNILDIIDKCCRPYQLLTSSEFMDNLERDSSSDED